MILNPVLKIDLLHRFPLSMPMLNIILTIAGCSREVDDEEVFSSIERLDLKVPGQ